MTTSEPSRALPLRMILPVGEPLEPIGVAHLGGRQVGERLLLVTRQGHQAVFQTRGDVENVLVVGLFELQPYARVETHQLGGAMKDLHRFGVDSLTGARLRGCAHEVFVSCHGVPLLEVCVRQHICRMCPLKKN